ncbi:MAG: hypothetical protein MUC60_03440 [Oscillatoria sp. Prado101]|nr:hypothetical protein [Oscillatoria sp. Prado101]
MRWGSVSRTGTLRDRRLSSGDIFRNSARNLGAIATNLVGDIGRDYKLTGVPVALS